MQVFHTTLHPFRKLKIILFCVAILATPNFQLLAQSAQSKQDLLNKVMENFAETKKGKGKSQGKKKPQDARGAGGGPPPDGIGS